MASTPAEPTEPPISTPPAGPVRLADPLPIALGLFGFALGVYGIRFVNVDAATLTTGPVSAGLNYAVLVAGLGGILAGILGVVRATAYPAYVTAIFGLWLVGFHQLITGAESAQFTPNALAWYVLILVVPAAVLAVPVIVHRNYPFIVVFVALIALLVLLGLGYNDVYTTITRAARTKTAPDLGSAVALLKASAYVAFVAAIALWFAFAQQVFALTGVLRTDRTVRR